MANLLKRFMPLSVAYMLLKDNGYKVESFYPEQRVFDADSRDGDSVRVFYGGHGDDLYVLNVI